MKVRTLSALTGLGGTLILSTSAIAAPQLVVVSQTLSHMDPFLSANDLDSFVIGITGFAPGENLQGFIGTDVFPWNISSGTIVPPNIGSPYFNVDSNGSYFDGQGQTAANALNAPPAGQWDTGVLANPITNALGAITAGGSSNPIGFAQYGINQNTGPNNDVFWLSLSPTGIPVSGTVPLFRITQFAGDYSTISFTIITNLGNGQGAEYYGTVAFGFIPAPGGFAVLGLAGVIGTRRRRGD